MTCRNCGYKNEPDARFCAQCGSPLGAPEGDEDSFEELEPEKKPSRAPLVLLVLCLCLVAAAGGLLWGWRQQSGLWPWEKAPAAASSDAASHKPMLPQGTELTYDAPAVAALIRASGFQDFVVSEVEIGGLQQDSRVENGAAILRFTVTKPMAVLQMQMRAPGVWRDSLFDENSAAASSQAEVKPTVSSWSVTEWRIQGCWNGPAGDALVIQKCQNGSLGGMFVPAGQSSGRTFTGTISNKGEISLVGSKLRVSGSCSPAGTAQLTVTLDGRSASSQQYVMLSTAIPKVSASSAAPSSAPPAAASAFPAQKNGFVFADSSSRLLTQADFAPILARGDRASVLAYARNEVYARHGFDFQVEPYHSYYYGQAWYQKLPKTKDVNAIHLSDVEKQNLILIKKYEDAA